jgi:hypothetical protein
LAQGSAFGTAPLARFWLALEQNGPWGAQAATQSHLDPDLGEALTLMCQAAGGRFILIRRPEKHSDPRDGDRQNVSPRRVYLAGGLAARPWLLEADLADPARLTRLAHPQGADQGSLSTLGTLDADDLAGIQDLLPELAHSPGPVLMICSNSSRDVCCSVRGRPVALESGSLRPGQVWECSHTGGHRFAPTGVLLPQGQSFARLSGASAVAVVDAAVRGEVPTALLGETHDRGRSHLSAPEQAAESSVRQQIQEPSLAALSTTTKQRPDQENTWQCRVSHVDGRRWDIEALRVPAGDDLPESCGKKPVPTWRWSVITGHGQ